jgi:hypothetical protein
MTQERAIKAQRARAQPLPFAQCKNYKNDKIKKLIP